MRRGHKAEPIGRNDVNRREEDGHLRVSSMCARVYAYMLDLLKSILQAENTKRCIFQGYLPLAQKVQNEIPARTV